MANNCFYTMYAEGKPEAIDELIARMTFKYDHSEGSEVENRTHFWRVFEADVYDLNPRTGGTRLVQISGDCAWSIWACMTAEGYAEDFAKDPKVAPYCTSLEKTSKELGIEIEVFSEEPSMEFAEHFHYLNGMTLANDETDFEEVYWDPDECPTFADLDKEYGLTARGVKECDCEPYEYIGIGGYKDVAPFCYEQSAA